MINVKNLEYGSTARVSRAMSERFAVSPCTTIHEELDTMPQQLDSAGNDNNIVVLSMLTNTIINLLIIKLIIKHESRIKTPAIIEEGDIQGFYSVQM